ncbi:MAG: ATP-binding protein, partial [Spirochaetaceae bacterium]|nr:ATP-binding protein [Spirochaetaceae bacterium]
MESFVPKEVKHLPPETALKIAAGEVIDRPCAIVRELIDNSLDAGATSISVELDSGGIEKIRVVDNGYGMTKEDLEICTESHTTSKITTEDDLLSLSTMGFRGEALSAISAVATLTILSSRDGNAH